MRKRSFVLHLASFFIHKKHNIDYFRRKIEIRKKNLSKIKLFDREACYYSTDVEFCSFMYRNIDMISKLIAISNMVMK